jgi:hypothetical protein
MDQGQEDIEVEDEAVPVDENDSNDEYDEEPELEQENENDDAASDIELEDHVTDETDIHFYERAYIPSLDNTIPYMTKYEYTRVLGTRHQMINNGAPPTVGPEHFPGGVYPSDTENIAKMELKMNRCPIMIKRPLPNGQNIVIPVSKLVIPGHLLH